MVKVVVEVQGGLVTSVTTDGPGVEVYVADRDLENWDQPTDWPDCGEVKALGGLQGQVESPRRVAAILGEIAAECDYCEGTGLAYPDPADSGIPCQECEGRGWWLPYAKPASADPGCACGLEDPGVPGHDGDAVPSLAPGEPAASVEFGEDVQHHRCGGLFELRCSAGFTGLDFNPDGYSYADLDLVWDESTLVCLGCFAEVDFATWQEAALAQEQAAQVGPDGMKSCTKGLGG